MEIGMINLITIIISTLSIVSIIILVSFFNLNKYFESTETLMKEKKINTPILNKDAYKFIKRIIDLCFGVFGIIILSPILIIIYIICKLQIRESPIVKITAIGENKKKFYIYKFVTINKDFMNIYPRKEYHFTKIGKFLYKTSLDELPSFFNLIKGDISIVGRTMYRERDRKDINFILKNVPDEVLNCKPGLTGLWQISRDKHEFNFESRIKYDEFYVKNSSIGLDIRIFIKTMLVGFGSVGTF